jgi:hypothetical protein
VNALQRAAFTAFCAWSLAARANMDHSTMQISTPTVPATPKALLDILKLEGTQFALPNSTILLGVSLAAFAVARVALHALDHSAVSALLYGPIVAALFAGATALFLKLYNLGDKTVQTIIALAATGAIIATASIILHFIFAVALPPPLPSDRLVRFLLFPIGLWVVFMFAFLYRHAGMRMIPAFALAITLVIVSDFILATLMK